MDSDRFRFQPGDSGTNQCSGANPTKAERSSVPMPPGSDTVLAAKVLAAKVLAAKMISYLTKLR